MPNAKVANLAGGLYRSDTPEQIPEVSWSDIANLDPINESLQTRDGYQQVSTTPVYPGCLQFGYNSPNITGQNYLKVQGGNYGPAATTHTVWSMFIYAKNFDTTPGNECIFEMTPADESFSILRLRWSAGNFLEAEVQPSSGDSQVTLTTSTTPSGDANIYGVTITPSTTATRFTMRIYDHSGVVGTTIVNGTNPFVKADTIFLGKQIDSLPSFKGYMGELVITKDEAVSTTLSTSYNVIPPADRCATANRIAYYPLHNDLKDEWELSPDFDTPPTFKIGAGLSTYQIEDTILTSPQATNELSYFHSIYMNTYNQDESQYFKSGGLAVSSTVSGYLNPTTGGSYTFACDFLCENMKSTSTTWTLFECGDYGPRVSVEYANKDELMLNFKHTLAPGSSGSVSTTIPMGLTDRYIFDLNHATGTSVVTMRIFKGNGLLKSGTWTGGPATSTVEYMYMFRNLVGTTHDTSGKDIEFYLGGFLKYNTSVATTWTKKPTADIKKVTTYKTKKTMVSKRVLKPHYIENLKGQFVETGGRFELEYVERTTRTAKSAIQQGEEKQPYNRYTLPNISNIYLMYFFNDFSEYVGADSSDDDGIIMNTIEQGNADLAYTHLEMQNNRAPSWVIDRNNVGLVTTGFLDDDYANELDNAFSFLPTRDSLGDKLLLGSNSNLIDSVTGTTYNFDHPWKWHRKESGKMRGLMYGNSLYIHNENFMFRFDGRNVFSTAIPTPITAPTITSTSSTNGINGAYIYGVTYTNKNGVESPMSMTASATVRLGSISVGYNIKDGIQYDMLRHTVESLNIYRNKGSVGTATTLINNNGTYMYLLETIPWKSYNETGRTGILLTDKVDDSALGRALSPQENTAIPPCKYSTLFAESGIFTGDPKAPNHYYISKPEVPEVLDIIGEFRTEDGEENSGTGKLGSGFIIFKNSSRKYVVNGNETTVEEYDNGGCVSHDSLVSVGNELMGLGPNGFFITNGSRYIDITKTEADGRLISDIQKDVDSWSLAVKQKAYAVYHAATDRYICYVNDKMYVFFTKKGVWTKYEDFVGLPIIYKGDFYIFKKGWLWKEYASQAYIGDAGYEATVSSGKIGEVVLVSTTTLPTTYESGLPVLVDNTRTWLKNLSASGTTYTARLESNADFSASSKVTIGIMECYSETKNFEFRTPSKQKNITLCLLEHDPVTNGKIDIRFARDSNDIDNSYSHFKGQADRGRIATWVRCMGRNIRLRFNMRDGKQHTLKSYTIEYEQLDYGY